MAPKGKSPRCYLLWGQEELRKREALAALIDELVPLEDRDLDLEYIDPTGPGVTGETILNAVRDRAMFSERRVVVLLNAGRLRGPRHQRTQEVLARGLSAIPEYSTLILVAYAEEAEERRGKAPLGEALMTAVRSAGKVLRFAALKPDELAGLAASEAAAQGKRLAPAAARLLVERVGSDSQQVLQETRKLAAYAGPEPEITAAAVAEMVPPRPDDNIFHMLDAVMAGDRKQALNLVQQTRASGAAFPVVLHLLARTLRQVAQAKFLQDRGVRPAAEPDAIPPELLAALPRETGLYGENRGWLRSRLWGQAGRISWPSLQQALGRLAVMDAGTKGWDRGVEDPDLALELFVESLCETLRAAPPRAASPGGRGYPSGRPAR